ncbi:MAG: CoA transferase [Alphaproteobacteria bacterium TMED89]|nr:carnitine dehydratase [Rhodospirillaceae bacterium]RPH12318.1 MAG: CoA transferase [Alphaproteobacteria bacterium TMED89]
MSSQSSQAASTSGPLAGLLVVSIEQAVAAPLCTFRLVQAGARVIKVERAGGETARHYDRATKGTSAYFAWLNAGKESAVLDLKSDDGLALLRAMIAKADVLVQNLAPGAMARMGLDAGALEALNPRLISLSVVGYDQSTSFAQMRAYDALVQAESGICSVTGTADARAKVGVSIADIGTGMTAHAAVLEALIERGISGTGKHLEIAMFDTMADWMSVPLLQYEGTGAAPKREGLAHASIYPYGAFGCADGAFLLSIQNQREWASLCSDVLERPDLIDHALYRDNPARSENRAALDLIMRPVFAGLSLAECEARMRTAGVAFGRLSEVADLASHPALKRRSVTLENGEVIEVPVLPGGSTDQNTAPRLPALGEHTDAIRAEFSSL